MKALGAKLSQWLGRDPRCVPGEFYIPVVAENLTDGRQSTLVVGVRTASLDFPRGLSIERARIRSHVKALHIAGEYYKRVQPPVLVRLRFAQHDETLRPAQAPQFTSLSTGHEIWIA